MNVGRDGQSVVQKVRAVLDCYIRSGELSLSFAELLEGSGLSRASVHRTLSEMVENGLLTQSGQREEYRLGPLMRSAAALVGVADLPSIARPHIERLRDECGETVVLAELHDAYVVPVMRADGLHEMRMNQEVGRRYPPYAGATAKVLLAGLAPSRREAILGRRKLEPLTGRTVTDRKRLAADLRLVSEAGVGVSVGERVPEAVAISAPVYDADGRQVAALTISGISSRYSQERLGADARRAREVAAAISADAGWRPQPLPDLDDEEGPAAAALDAMCKSGWEAARAAAAASG